MSLIYLLQSVREEQLVTDAAALLVVKVNANAVNYFRSKLFLNRNSWIASPLMRSFFCSIQAISEKFAFILIELKTIQMLLLTAVIPSIKSLSSVLNANDLRWETLQQSMGNSIKFPFEEASYSSFSRWSVPDLSLCFDICAGFFLFSPSLLHFPI